MSNPDLDAAAERVVDGICACGYYTDLKARVIAELERAVRNEREACAREAEKYAHGFFIANQLRARGQR